MAELTRDAVLAALDVPVLQDRAADARAQRDHDQVVLTPAGAEAPFRPGGRIGVVVDHHGDHQPGGDGVAEGLVAPGQVRGEQHLGAVRVHPARRADADGVHVVAVGEVEDQLDDGVLDDLRALRLVRRLGAQGLQDVAVGVHDTGHHLGAADVDADRGHPGRREVRAPLPGADGPQDGGAGGAAVCEVAVRAHRPCAGRGPVGDQSGGGRRPPCTILPFPRPRNRSPGGGEGVRGGVYGVSSPTGRPPSRSGEGARSSSWLSSSSSLPPAICRVSSSSVTSSLVWLPDIAPRFSSTKRSPTR